MKAGYNTPFERGIKICKSYKIIIRLVTACRLILTGGGGLAYNKNDPRGAGALQALFSYRQSNQDSQSGGSCPSSQRVTNRYTMSRGGAHGGYRMKWALVYDKRSSIYFVTRADRAKRLDFLEIIAAGTYKEMIEARRRAESPQE